MGAHGAGRVEIAEPFLNGKTLNRVGIITRPNLRRVAQHTKIKTVTPGGTGLQKDMGARGKDAFQHLVKPQHIAVGQLPARRDSGIKIAHVAVHIPLDIGDGAMVQKMGNVVNDIIPHLRTGKIKQELVPSHRGLPSRLL